MTFLLCCITVHLCLGHQPQYPPLRQRVVSFHLDNRASMADSGSVVSHVSKVKCTLMCFGSPSCISVFYWKSEGKCRTNAAPQTPAEHPRQGNVNSQDPKSKVNRQDSERKVNEQDPKNKDNGHYPKSKVNGLDPKSKVNGHDPKSKVNGQDPKSKVNGKDPKNKINGHEPKSKVNGQDPKSKMYYAVLRNGSMFRVERESIKLQCFGSTCLRYHDDSPNKDFKVNPVFLNKNPRNLETMGIARKRQGWILQYPRKNFYHKLFFERSARHTSAWVEHMNGETVVSASTREWAVREQLYSTSDVSAAENVGRVLAQRCVESGLTSVFYDRTEDDTPSESREAFMKAVEDVVTLREPRQLKPRYEPGIDYDRPNRYGEKKKLKPDYQIS